MARQKAAASARVQSRSNMARATNKRSSADAANGRRLRSDVHTDRGDDSVAADATDHGNGADSDVASPDGAQSHHSPRSGSNHVNGNGKASAAVTVTSPAIKKTIHVAGRRSAGNRRSSNPKSSDTKGNGSAAVATNGHGNGTSRNTGPTDAEDRPSPELEGRDDDDATSLHGANKRRRLVSQPQEDANDEAQFEPVPESVYAIPPYPQDGGRSTRTYTGPLKRGDRRPTMATIMFEEGLSVFRALIWRWKNHPLPAPRNMLARCPLPGEVASDPSVQSTGQELASPWLYENFEDDQIDVFRRWYRAYKAAGSNKHKGQYQRSISLPEKDGQALLPYRGAEGTLFVFAQQLDYPVTMGPGQGILLGSSHAGPGSMDKVPGTDARGKANGDAHLFNGGGRVCSLAWAPTSSSDEVQLLAVAASSLGIQKNDDKIHPQSLPCASTQFWTVPLTNESSAGDHGRPELVRVIGHAGGWPTKLQWCPVPLLTGPGATFTSVYGLLAVLTEDGTVQVIEVTKKGSKYEMIRDTIATLGDPTLPQVHATCMTWTGVNQLAVGHKDGSITLWSIRPQTMLVRHPAHSSPVLDICSAFPSYPSLVASRPLDGVDRLIDLQSPSNEHTFNPNPGVSFQAGLLGWSEHLRGFAALAPSHNPTNNRLDFMHIKHFPFALPFYASSQDAQPTSMSIGATHPYVAVGRSDGSVYVSNMMDSVFQLFSPRLPRMRVFDATGSFEGPFKALQVDELVGVRINLEHVPDIEDVREDRVSTPDTPAGKNSQEPATPRGAADDEPAGEGKSGTAVADEDLGNTSSGANRLPVHDPRAAVSAIAWNPNLGLGTWCAIGMGSGLVCVKNMGWPETAAERGFASVEGA